MVDVNVELDISSLTSRLDTMNGHLNSIVSALGTGENSLATHAAAMALSMSLFQLDFLGCFNLVQGAGLNIGVITGLGTVEEDLQSLDATLGITNERLQTISGDIEDVGETITGIASDISDVADDALLYVTSLDNIDQSTANIVNKLAGEDGTVAGSIDALTSGMATDMETASSAMTASIEENTDVLVSSFEDLAEAMATNIGNRISSGEGDDLTTVLAEVGLAVGDASELIGGRIAEEGDSCSASIATAGGDVSDAVDALALGISGEGEDNISVSLANLATALSTLDTSFNTQGDLMVAGITSLNTNLSDEESYMMTQLKAIADATGAVSDAIGDPGGLAGPINGRIYDIYSTLNKKLENITVAIVACLSNDYDWDEDGYLTDVVGFLRNGEEVEGTIHDDLDNIGQNMLALANQHQDVDITGPTGYLLRISNSGPPFIVT